MRRCVTSPAFAAFLAGLLVGSGLALLGFWPDRGLAPLAVSSLAGGLVLLAAAIVTVRRRPGPDPRASGRDVVTARPRPGGLDDVAAVVAALEALRRGSMAHGGGS